MAGRTLPGAKVTAAMLSPELALSACGSSQSLSGSSSTGAESSAASFRDAVLPPAFAAVFPGGTQLRPGHANVRGTLIAIFVLAIGVQGLELTTGEQWVRALFNGVALLAAAALAAGRGGVRLRSRCRPQRSVPGEPLSRVRVGA